MLAGLRVIESLHLVEDGEPIQVQKSWRERWFGWPWRPWVTSYTVVPKVPYKGAIRVGPNTVVMHPETVRVLKHTL